ncbi:LysE family transporter [Arthrobacter sp.]|uniref:LysE family transporter n=1 Tax=Arthrobacter sp. TaxID=1667 RepID=UPI002897A854|nr:LysE family transporter [Arthrobacter sp.]
MDVITALAGGVLAGFGVAAPLGAVGVLLLREGLAAGFREAAPAAFAVALVDAAYCTLAILAGTAAAPLITSWGALPALSGGVALMLLGLVGIRRTWRSGPGPAPEAGPAPPSSFKFPESSKRRRFVLFVSLTAINPMTLFYFAALAVGLRDVLSPPAGPWAFIIGVSLGSLAWQLGLVFSGAYLRGRTTGAVQRTLSMAGHATVAVLGLGAVAVSAVSYG